MRKIEIYVSEGELIIFDWPETDPNHPDFSDENPIHLPLEDALATIDLEGYGQNLSRFIIQLSGYSWAGEFYVDEIIKFLKSNYSDCPIDWNATQMYLDQLR